MGKHASGGEDPSPFLEVHGQYTTGRTEERTDGHAMINGAAFNFHRDDAVQSYSYILGYRGAPRPRPRPCHVSRRNCSFTSSIGRDGAKLRLASGKIQIAKICVPPGCACLPACLNPEVVSVGDNGAKFEKEARPLFRGERGGRERTGTRERNDRGRRRSRRRRGAQKILVIEDYPPTPPCLCTPSSGGWSGRAFVCLCPSLLPFLHVKGAYNESTAPETGSRQVFHIQILFPRDDAAFKTLSLNSNGTYYNYLTIN